MMCAGRGDRQEQNGLTEAEIARRLNLALRQAPLLDPSKVPDPPPRPAAVLLPLLWDNEGWSLLYTRRTDTLQNHKGQVAFPGGAADPGDRSPEDTALREAYEEIGLNPQEVRILGRLPEMVTNSNYLITPIVGRIPWPYVFHASPEEVSRVFTMPLRYLAEPANWEERERINRLGLPERVVYYQPFDGELLWGITGRLTVEFLRILGI